MIVCLAMAGIQRGFYVAIRLSSIPGICIGLLGYKVRMPSILTDLMPLTVLKLVVKP